MLTIIGCGNPNRRDDGVGVEVAQRLSRWLQAHRVSGVQAIDAGTAGMEVMFRARGSDALIVVDANDSGSEPGAIFEVPGEELANVPEPGYNLHDFRWDHALYAGKKIYGDAFPKFVKVFLIEAKKTDLGLDLTPEVEAAARKVVDQIALLADAGIAGSWA